MPASEWEDGPILRTSLHDGGQAPLRFDTRDNHLAVARFQLSDGAAYRMFRDRATGAWFVEGGYD